jgi:hypothetical protein
MDGNGRRNDDSMVKDSGARQQWTAQGQLNGEGRRIGNMTTMDDKDDASVMAMSMRPAMEATNANTTSID